MSKLAIFGGEPIRKKPFQYLPDYDEKEEKAVMDVFRTRVLSGFHKSYRTGGPKVMEFEDKFSKYHNMNYAVAFNSGTAALHAGLVALGVTKGDEVIVPSYTFTATASSVLMCNAIPIFCDVNKDTFNVNTENIRSLITKKTKAIIPVHLVGNPCDMGPIIEIANEYNIKILEDCAQSPGAKYKGKLVGTIGDIGAFSFVETKNMVTGEGGMIITNNSDYNDICRLVRSHGEILVSGGRSYLSKILGWNYRMTEFEAAIGIEQLKKLESLNKYRILNTQYLDKGINFDGISKLKIPNQSYSVAHVCPLLFDENKVGVTRDVFLKGLNAEGIEADKGYPHPLYMNPIFLNNDEGKYYKGMNPIAEDLCSKSAIWIRKIMYPNNFEDMQDIINGFTKVMENVDSLKSLEN